MLGVRFDVCASWVACVCGWVWRVWGRQKVLCAWLGPALDSWARVWASGCSLWSVGWWSTLRWLGFPGVCLCPCCGLFARRGIGWCTPGGGDLGVVETAFPRRGLGRLGWLALLSVSAAWLVDSLVWFRARPIGWLTWFSGSTAWLADLAVCLDRLAAWFGCLVRLPG